MATQLLEPTVTDQSPAISAAQRLSDVRGKRLGFVDNSKCNADLFIQRLSAQLTDRFAAVHGPVIRKAAPKDRLTEGDLANLAQCDAVVHCFGDCGTSTSISVADAVEIETPRHSERHRVQHGLRLCGPQAGCGSRHGGTAGSCRFHIRCTRHSAATWLSAPMPSSMRWSSASPATSRNR